MIVAAHCIFPLTHDSELQKTLGTRHRAGIGITEETDAVAVIAFGGDKTASNGTFKIEFPAADASNAIIRLA